MRVPKLHKESSVHSLIRVTIVGLLLFACAQMVSAKDPKQARADIQKMRVETLAKL